ncbi:MAG: hypothetical protein M9909_11140 [Thermomicrobiales bacterium]|nr:hypothetical protein [Thermomicrobiales bacterium]
MTPVRITQLVKLLLVMMLCLGSSSVVTAQEAQPMTIRPELIDSIIEIRGQNYVLDHADLEEYPHGRGERIYISSLESKGFAEISFFDDEDSPEQTIAVMLSEFESASSRFEVLKQGNVGSIYYALAHFRLPGYEGYFYIEVAQDVDGNVDIQQNFYSLNADFSEQLALVREDVTIDGVPFLQAPVIDLDDIIAEHAAQQATLAATPVVETYVVRDTDVTIVSPVRSYNELSNDVLDVVFFSTATGEANGLIGYLQDDETIPANVIRAIVADTPQGERPAEEIEVQTLSDEHAVGLYLVPSREGDMLMVISASRHDEGIWRIESLAAPPDAFMSEYQEIIGHVSMDNRPIFEDTDIESLIDDAEMAP